MNVGGISKIVNYVNIVYMVLSVELDWFVIVDNLYIMFGITLNILEFVLYMFEVKWHYVDMSSYLLLFFFMVWCTSNHSDCL